MDDFLTNLFHEDLEKNASVQAGEMMDNVPLSELEEYLGINKTAVAGPAAPPLPDPAQGAELNAKQKAVSDYVNKERLSSIADRSDGADVHVSFQGEGTKQPEEHTDEALQVSKQAMAYADHVGRVLAKTAAAAMAPPPGGVQQTHRTGFVPVGSGMGAVKGGVLGAMGGMPGSTVGGALLAKYLGRSPVLGALGGAAAGALGGGALGAGTGAGLSALKRVQIKSDQKQLQRLNQAIRDEGKKKKEKKSEFDSDDGGGMETTAAIRADIADRAIRATAGAPPHIKHAAAVAAARRMTKAAGIGGLGKRIGAMAASKRLSSGAIKNLGRGAGLSGVSSQLGRMAAGKTRSVGLRQRLQRLLSR